jgi:hypothetical protein
MPTLTIQLPGFPPVEHVLRDETVTVGRMKGNSIALDDASISLSHAKITRFGADFYLKDLNSTNGTMLNGQSVSEARLGDGDQLQFGDVIALFRTGGAAMPGGVGAMQAAARSVPALIHVAPLDSTRPADPVVVVTAPEFRRRPRRVLPVIAGILGACVAAATLAVVVWMIINGNFSDPAQPSAPNAPAAPTARKSAVAGKSAPAPVSPGAHARAAAPAMPASGALPAPDAPRLASLIRDLQSTDVVSRRRAAEAINSFEGGAKDAIPVLQGALADADADVRIWSALALVNNQVYEKSSVPSLLQALHHETPALRQMACIALALFPHDESSKAEVVSALQRTAASDDSTEVRTDARHALKIIAPDSAGAR